MKTKIKSLILLSLVVINWEVKAQFTDPAAAAANQMQITLQVEQLARTIEQVEKTREMIKQGREQIEKAKQIVKFTQQTASIMQAIADGRVSLEMISDLKINDLKGLMKDVLCIDIDQFTRKDKTNIKILLRFKNSLIGCGNNEFYDYTFSGIARKVNDGTFFKFINDQQQINKLTKKQLDYEIAKIDQAIEDANNQYKFSQTIGNEMNNVSYKYYYNLAEELFERSKDMYDKLNSTRIDSDGKQTATYEMSQFERQQLIMACIEYQMKAFEYKERAIAMLKEVSSPKNGYEDLRRVRSQMAARRFNMNVWGKGNY